MKYEQLAKEVIREVGGEENIIRVMHCVTRLRFKLKDERLVKMERLKRVEGVLSVIQSAGQFQVVIGSHVSDVYEAVLKVGNLVQPLAEESSEVDKGNMFNRFVDVVFSVFTPILGLLLASGLFKGSTVMATSLGWLDTYSGTYIILNATGDALFQFLPIFLGYTGMKKFGGSPFMGMLLGAILIYPTFIGIPFEDQMPLDTLFKGTIIESPIYFTFFRMPVVHINYAASLLPVVLATYVAAKLERALQLWIPSDLKTLLIPFLTLLVIVPITFLFIGPLATWGGNLVGHFIFLTYELSPVGAGFLFGGIWQVLVLFGLHWLLIPVALHNVLTNGYDVAIVAMFGASFAQMGAVLAVWMKTKNKKIRDLSLPAILSGAFGVLEPAIYGITLPLKKPFVMSCIAAAVAGAITGFFRTKIYLVGGLGVFGIPNHINPEVGFDSSFRGGLIAMGVAFLLAFSLTYIFGFNEQEEESIELDLSQISTYMKKIT